MKQCQLYVQPSRHEGYSTTLVEAKTLACTILATDIPSNREQIIEGVNGFLVELDADKIADKIIELTKNQEQLMHVKEYLYREDLDFSGEISKLEALLKD